MTTSHLIAVDGSEPSTRAVKQAIVDATSLKECPHIYLVNVQPALPSNVTRFIDDKTVDDFQRETGEQALALAKAKLTTAGLAFSSHILVGEAAPTIVEFAQEKHCSQIIMGAHGFGSVVGLFMGSVTVKVVHLSPVPVLLVK
ncbi:universal stress protein [Rhodoferax sp. U11-2br]|uniref:universal stress protein n=1 Tax=Rhodoferax sp. U11-2br TaxID=2838878 RepID=UPI001BE7D0FE|nr:universal stress protein [Rhodoferax sp. U11-2br]MBT3065537.1 universal stress protein [Rhodoferax sp. U11-2br]